MTLSLYICYICACIRTLGQFRVELSHVICYSSRKFRDLSMFDNFLLQLSEIQNNFGLDHGVFEF